MLVLGIIQSAVAFPIALALTTFLQSACARIDDDAFVRGVGVVGAVSALRKSKRKAVVVVRVADCCDDDDPSSVTAFAQRFCDEHCL
jgi:hypothetical protein